MIKITPNPPVKAHNAFPSSDPAKDKAAVKRALDYYLPNATTPPPNDTPLATEKPTLKLEEALVHISELLSCASATAYESGDGLSGSQRALAFSVMHLVELAKAVADRSLDNLSA